MLTHAPWTGIPGFRHGFLDRHVAPTSEGWSICGTSRRVVVPRQVHGTRVVSVEADGGRPDADGLSTAPPAPPAGIVTADCVPVLLVDRHRGAAAAIHAGWRGAAQGVVEAAIDHLAVVYGTRPEDLEAAIGPAIGGCCYEVGPEVAAAFRARTGDRTAAAWHPGPRREHLDLRRAISLLLSDRISAIAVLGPCTACDPAYHSYRRDGSAVGRQLSFVGWE